MDRLYFFLRRNSKPSSEAGFFMPFQDIVQRFLLTRGDDDLAYLTRWTQDNEELAIVLDDFIRQQLDATIDTAQEFTHLLTALLVYLEGGDPVPYLEQPSDELQARYLAELDEFNIS